MKKLVFSGHSEDNLHIADAIDNDASELNFNVTHTAGTKLFEKIVKNGTLLKKDEIKDQIFSSGVPIDEVFFLPLERLISDEEKRVVSDIFNLVLDSGRFTTGPYVEKFENELKTFLNLKHVVTCCSGTDALIVSLLAVGIKVGDEVILPANSFAATENAILAIGGVPVYADIDPVTYNIDPDDIKNKITGKTRAILPVNLYGKVSNTKDISRVIENTDLLIVEDACQSIGGTGTAKYSDVAVFSFNPFKNFSVCGKAGAIGTNDSELFEKIKRFSYHGFDPSKKNVKDFDFGYNSKMDNTHAAVALARLPFLGLNNFKRLFLASRYSAAMGHLEILKVPEISADHAWHLYTVELLSGNRDDFRAKLKNKHSIETDIYYPVLSHKHATNLVKTKYMHISLPITELTHSRMLSLPLHQNLSIQEQDMVIDAILNECKKL